MTDVRFSIKTDTKFRYKVYLIIALDVCSLRAHSWANAVNVVSGEDALWADSVLGSTSLGTPWGGDGAAAVESVGL